MPAIPALDRISFTSSSLKGLMMASIFFIALLRASVAETADVPTFAGTVSNGDATPPKDGEGAQRRVEPRRSEAGGRRVRKCARSRRVPNEYASAAYWLGSRECAL